MKHIKALRRYLIVIIFCFFTVQTVHAQEQIGWVISKTSGKAEQKIDGMAPIEIVKGSPLYSGYTICTIDCLLKVQLEDESVITINEDTEMLIQRNKETLDRPIENKNIALKFDFAMNKGESRFQITKRNQMKSIQTTQNNGSSPYLMKSNKLYKNITVKTPSVLIGIRGSDFSVKIIESTSKMVAGRVVAQPERTEVLSYEDTYLELYQLDHKGDHITTSRTEMGPNELFYIIQGEVPVQQKIGERIQDLIVAATVERRYQINKHYTDKKMHTELDATEVDETIEDPDRVIDTQEETNDTQREDRVKKLPIYPHPPSHSP
jgi:hypothetical protein